jgi:hypothetical protein
VSPGPTPPPAFVDTTGEATSAAPYPAGPYGVDIGSVIENFPLDGFRNPKANRTTLESIQLADFYNPHARDTSYAPPAGAQDDRDFPATSGYPNAGMLKPTALLIDIASVWCGPCNDEAANILPVQHAAYDACGGEFLLSLADSATPGITATPANLTAWTTEYKLDYPSSIDPAYLFQPIEAQGVYPQNIVIDTTTMKIVAILGGEAIPTACGATADGLQCSQANVAGDCQTCGVQGYPGICGDGSPCSTNADCAAIPCTQVPFWTKFEGLLDKTRAGCTVK